MNCLHERATESIAMNLPDFQHKSIYRKLSFNKRVQAIEKAREKRLI